MAEANKMATVPPEPIIRDAYEDMLLDGLLEKEKYKIQIKSNFSTASWSYQPPHVIFIGDEAGSGVHLEDQPYYLSSFLYHEVAHSKWTERDLASVNEALQESDIPFSLFNLLEDARIEHLMRTETDRYFDWAKYEDLPEAKGNPQTLFFNMIQEEIGSKPIPEHIEEDGLFDDVHDFYKKCINAEDTWDVMEIALDWVTKWPQSQKDSEDTQAASGDSIKTNDVKEAIEMHMNDQKFQQAMQGSKELKGASDGDDDEKEKNVPDEVEKPDGNGEMLEEFTTSRYEGLGNCKIDKQLVSSLHPRLQKAFLSKSSKVNTRIPSKRLNIREVAAGGNDKIYRRKKEIAASRKNINLVIDCSGSMGMLDNLPIDSAATFASIVSKIAASGKIRGHVILSSSNGYQVFKMPMSDSQIENTFAPLGTEGLANTVRETMPLLKKADRNIFLTDGMIADGPLNKAELRKNGISTLGCYVGDPENTDLSPWFEKGIARRTLKELVSELVLRFRKI